MKEVFEAVLNEIEKDANVKVLTDKAVLNTKVYKENFSEVEYSVYNRACTISVDVITCAAPCLWELTEEQREPGNPFKIFSSRLSKVIYTTNAIESLNSSYKRLNRQRSVFPSDILLLKALYLATFEATKKWTLPLRNWGKVYGELSIMYGERLEK